MLETVHEYLGPRLTFSWRKSWEEACVLLKVRMLQGSIIPSLYKKEGGVSAGTRLFCRSDYLLEIYLFPFR